MHRVQETKCPARAKTCDGQLISIDPIEKHDHLSSSNRVIVKKTIIELKERSLMSEDNPSRIVQRTLDTVDADVQPYLPTESAMNLKVV